MSHPLCALDLGGPSSSTGTLDINHSQRGLRNHNRALAAPKPKAATRTCCNAQQGRRTASAWVALWTTRWLCWLDARVSVITEDLKERGRGRRGQAPRWAGKISWRARVRLEIDPESGGGGATESKIKLNHARPPMPQAICGRLRKR